MESFVFKLEKLSDEVCWLILSQIAFIGKDKELCRTLEYVGKEIAKKCRGLPLAATTLGGLLGGKSSLEEWQNVLNSELWKLNFEHFDDIFAPLFLSYYDLPSRIRPCFLYCVIFPKDYVMEKYELVTHWMAQGYLNSGDDNIEMESLGEEYFDYLASRSLFQDFTRDENGSIDECKMHDIVHDFVKFLAKDEISIKEVGSEEMLDLTSVKVRHLRIIHLPQQSDVVSAGLPFIKGKAKLRSFISERWEDRSTSAEDLLNLCKGGKCLRLLEVHSLVPIPKEVGKLIHLRYLSINLCGSMPEIVYELHNLLYLEVSAASELPNGIEKLINLRHLICRGSQYYPKGIARLTSLRTLDPIIAKSSNDSKFFSMGDLANLDHLRGRATVFLDGETVDMEELKRAKLYKKIHLKELAMYFKRTAVIPVVDVFIQALNLPPSVGLSLII